MPKVRHQPMCYMTFRPGTLSLIGNDYLPGPPARRVLLKRNRLCPRPGHADATSLRWMLEAVRCLGRRPSLTHLAWADLPSVSVYHRNYSVERNMSCLKTDAVEQGSEEHASLCACFACPTGHHLKFSMGALAYRRDFKRSHDKHRTERQRPLLHQILRLFLGGLHGQLATAATHTI